MTLGRLGVLVGSSALGPGGERLTKAVREAGAVPLQRHGGAGGAYVPPHRIDHEANLRRLSSEGCDRVLAVSSVGSLRAALGAGSLLCPDDFIALHLGLSIFEDARGHGTRGFNRGWRDRVLAAWAEAETEAGPLRDGGVYWQAVGPRFETPAEIRLIAAHADVVGMTLASECIVAAELGLPYAAICVVDNLANGIGEEPLSLAEFEAGREASAAALAMALGSVVPRLAEVPA
jgi:5'-methylthioadenosine phosphorylase